MAPRRSATDTHGDDDGTDGELGVVRHPVHRVDGVEPAGQVAVGGHGEGGAAHADEEREQHAERGDGAADPHRRGEPVERARRARRSPAGAATPPARPGPTASERGRHDHGVDDER